MQIVDAPAADDQVTIRDGVETGNHVEQRRLAAARGADQDQKLPCFHSDIDAFENFITGRDAVERAQWRNVWPVTSGFRYRMDDIRALVSPDRLFAIGVGVFDSTGYHEDGLPYERPGRTTVALSRRRIGEDWVADHTHMSLFRDVPSRSFGKKPGG